VTPTAFAPGDQATVNDPGDQHQLADRCGDGQLDVHPEL
jgi:hypothetical protein